MRITNPAQEKELVEDDLTNRVMEQFLMQEADFLQLEEVEMDYVVPDMEPPQWEPVHIKPEPISMTELDRHLFGHINSSFMEITPHDSLVFKWEPMEEEDHLTLLQPVSLTKTEPLSVAFVGTSNYEDNTSIPGYLDEYNGPNLPTPFYDNAEHATYFQQSHPTYGFNYTPPAYPSATEIAGHSTTASIEQPTLKDNFLNLPFHRLSTSSPPLNTKNPQFSIQKPIIQQHFYRMEQLQNTSAYDLADDTPFQKQSEQDDDIVALLLGDNSPDNSHSASPPNLSPASSTESAFQSQDEILEEIQRECAEIERHSMSASPPESIQTDADGRQKKSRSRKTKIASEKPYAMKQQPRRPHKLTSSTDLDQDIEEVDEDLTQPGTSDRKKALNRVAATRYREKKRQEREKAQDEFSELDKRNRELRAELTSVNAEIRYLEGLLNEIRDRSVKSQE